MDINKHYYRSPAGEKIDINSLDYRLILELQKNPRCTNKALAKLFDVNEATIHRHIQDLVNSGTIIFSAIPNHAMMGYPNTVILLLQVKLANIKTVGDYLVQCHEIHWVATCAGGTDIIAWGCFASNEHLSHFLETNLGKLPGLIRTEIRVQFKTIKYTQGRIEDPSAEWMKNHEAHANIELDKNDIVLIKKLQENSRRSDRELALTMGLSAATTRRKVKRMIQSHVIELTTLPVLSNDEKLICAAVGLEVDLSNIYDIAGQLAKFPQIHYVGLCSGQTQIIIGIYTHSARELSEFITYKLATIVGIVRTETIVQLNTLKKTYGQL